MHSEDTQLPSIVDSAALRLEELFNKSKWPRFAGKALAELSRRSREQLPPPGPRLAGAEAASYLAELITITEREIIAAHSAYPSLQWRWYLRSLPNKLFDGSYRSTAGYDRALAEAVAWNMPRGGLSLVQKKLTYRVDSSAVRHIVDYIARIKFLSNLHIAYRRIGKGATLDTSTPIFDVTNDDRTNLAIEIYDQRHDQTESTFGKGMGIAPLDSYDYEQFSRMRSTDDLTLFLVIGCESISVPLTHPGPDGRLVKAFTQARHFIFPIDAKSIFHPFGPRIDTSSTMLSAVAAIVQMLMIFPVLISEIPWAFGSTLQVGYFLINQSIAKKLFDTCLPQINGHLIKYFEFDEWPNNFEMWAQSADSVLPSLWPLKTGGIYQACGDQYILFDFHSASAALGSRLEIDRKNPDLGNIRGDKFEKQCQEIIDGSKWNPTPAIAALRGKHLRRDGAQVTDIDAIGEYESTILIVSCKSVVYDALYDRGEYGVIRNAAATVDAAVEHWENLIESFRSTPAGDNFDFSRFANIIGIVCTPFAVFTSNDRSLSPVVGSLRACASISELRAWLYQDD
ncbi:MAG: hypothetical protein IPI75_04410 [Gammaproteobacteria bacterium]|nr:hypothetical protein [Gammaproteobacteria bacterium]